MADHELTLRLNEHRWDALELELQRQGTSIRERMEKQLYELYDEMVCGETYECTEAAIADEQAKEMERSEPRQHFAAFHIRENGADEWFAVERQTEPIGAAERLRDYTNGQWVGMKLSRFAELFHGKTALSQEQYEMRTAQGLDQSRYVAEIYDVDLERGLCSRLDYAYGWRTFRITDVCAAVEYAAVNENLTWAEKNGRFKERLAGKQVEAVGIPVCIRGDRDLYPEEVSVFGGIDQNDQLLNFHTDVYPNIDDVFGTRVNTFENNDWVNVYANYDLERGCVCDTLEVFLEHDDGSSVPLAYRLNPELQAVLLFEMDKHCRETLGYDLETARSEYMAENFPDEVQEPLDLAQLDEMRLRLRLHQRIDARFDKLVCKTILGSAPEGRCVPLRSGLAALKGEKPSAVILPGKEPIQVKTWRQAALAIMQDCCADPERREQLMDMRGKIHGNFRSILSDRSDDMGAPLKVADGLYMEGDFDTGALLRVLTTKILNRAGYDYSSVVFQLREQEQTQQAAQSQEETPPTMGMTMGQTM